MLAAENVQVHSNVGRDVKERLTALRALDKVLYSESRVISECIAAWLEKVEARANSFHKPTHRTPGRQTVSRVK